MEAVIVKNQSVSGFNNKKQTRAPKKSNTTRSFSPKRSENLAPTSLYESLLHFPHHSLSFSCPPSSASAILSQPYQYQRNPPLLPLPVAPISRSYSLSAQPRKNLHRSGDQSVNTPGKQRSKPNNPTKPAKSEDESLVVVASTNRLGPEPGNLPRDVPKVLSEGPVVVLGDRRLEKFSAGSAISLWSPPPSSLPLPRFSLRPSVAASKLSCNAEAAGIDAGATDNLCRILRLR